MDTIVLGFCLLLLAMATAVSLFPFLAMIGATRWVIFHLMRMATLQRTRPALREALSRLSLSSRSKGLALPENASGRLLGMPIHVAPAPCAFEWRERRRSPGALEIRFELEAPLPHRFAVVTRDEMAALLHSRSAEPVRTYDESFDEEIAVYGGAAAASARLDADLRQRLLHLSYRAGIRVEGGEIVFVLRRPIIVGAVLAKLIERMAQLARDLSADGPAVASRLLANAMSERSPAVRYHNLDLLLREFPSSAEAAEAMRLAWDAPERGIRYLAAIRRADDGLPFLLETAEAKGESAQLRTMVIRHLAHHAPRETALLLLRRMLKDGDPAISGTAAELLGKLRDAGSAVPLVALLARESAPEEMRILALDALGAIGPTEDGCGERYLTDHLGSGRFACSSMALKISAVAALGKVGSRRAIRVLRSVRARYRGTAPLAEGARSAIGRIELRCGPVERGQLSLAAIAEAKGALSVDRDRGGALSRAAEI